MVVVIEHVAWEHLGQWQPLLAARHIPLSTVRLYQGQSFPSLEDVNGVVVLGGPMNVYQEEKYPTLRNEDRFIREAVAKGIPYLGVCLGAQLLAKALGSRVYANRVKEIGYYPLELTQEGKADPLLGSLGSPFTAFQWHGDTFDVPQGAQLLATSAACHNQAFRYGRTAYALQFHVEAGPETVDDWARRYPRELASAGLSAPTLAAEAEVQERALGEMRRRVLDSFLSVAGIVPAPARETGEVTQ